MSFNEYRTVNYAPSKQGDTSSRISALMHEFNSKLSSRGEAHNFGLGLNQIFQL